MAQRLFTLAEANAELAEVGPLVAEMVARRRTLLESQARRAEVLGEIAGNGGGIPPSELGDLAEEEERAAEALAEAIARIHERGVLVKDLDAGLVDFPTIRDGEEVLLCWRLGEDAIRFWHGVDEGFAGRKPV